MSVTRSAVASLLLAAYTADAPPPAIPIPELATFSRPALQAGAVNIGFDSEEDAEARLKGGYFTRNSDHVVRDVKGTFGVTLRDENGIALPTISFSKQLSEKLPAEPRAAFVIAPAGTRYSIHIQSSSKTDLEIAVSVAFVDVFTRAHNQGVGNIGEALSFSARGALVAPGASIEVIGMEQRTDVISAFVVPDRPVPRSGSRNHNGAVLGHGAPNVRVAAYAKSTQ